MKLFYVCSCIILSCILSGCCWFSNPPESTSKDLTHDFNKRSCYNVNPCIEESADMDINFNPDMSEMENINSEFEAKFNK